MRSGEYFLFSQFCFFFLEKMPDSDSDEEELLQYKIILLGDGTVGKTSIATRFTNDTFGQSYKQVPAPPSAHAQFLRFTTGCWRTASL